MPSADLGPVLEAACRAALGSAGAPDAVQTVGGGCINRCYRVARGKEALFVKVNAARYADAFAAEADGLRALAEAGLRAPAPRAQGESGGYAYLALEWLDLAATGRAGGAALGRALAALHRVAPANGSGTRFGWHRDNYIGATPQANAPCDDWPSFWRERRLAPQLALAAGYARELSEVETVMDSLERLFRGHAPQPSLVHGDLWGGNAGSLADGTPVVFDPAVYRGDRETDLAMTELFGGFARDFYAAYEEVWPLDAGYALRRDLYNLYHVLNHLNLFGAGYLGQARALARRLRAEL